MDNITRSYLDPSKGNLLSPLPAPRSSRLFSETDPIFLERTSSTSGIMPVKRCSTCHLYIDGAPSPSLVHDGKFGPSCQSRHHPDPCEYASKDQGPCTFYKSVTSAGSGDENSPGNLSPDQMHTRDMNRQEEMNRMAAELVSMREKQEAMDTMAAEMVQMKEILKSLRPPAPIYASLDNTVGPPAADLNRGHGYVSAPPTTTLTSTAPSIAQPQSTGSYSNVLGQLGAASLESQSSFLEDVTSHIQKNTCPPATVQSRGSYSGPTMTEIRKDDQLDAIALRVLAALESRIPQIKETFASVTTQNPDPKVNPTLPRVGIHTMPQQQHYSTNTNVTRSLHHGPVSSVQIQPTRQGQDTYHPAYNALADGASATGGGLGATGGPTTENGPSVLPGDDFLDAASIMQLCTVSNRRQVRPHEFAKMGRFSYASKITDKNITVPLYVMGYLQHVVALLKGVVPVQSDSEVVDRLSNLMTIMEITANNSTLDDFKCHGWSIGLEYAGRVFHDIEYGRIKWENLSEGLQPHTFLYAKDTVEMQQSKASRGGGSQSQQRGRGRGQGRGQFGSRKSDDSQDTSKVCVSYNGFFTGSGCAYEYTNNRKCSYEHYCSNCFTKSGKKEAHKSCNCNEQEVKQSSGVNSAKAVVTSG